MSGIRIPKSLTVFLHKCPNTECINNRDNGGRCKWGIKFGVPYCGQYTREECKDCINMDAVGCIQAFNGLRCIFDKDHSSGE